MNFNYDEECSVCMEKGKPFYVLLCAHTVCTDGARDLKVDTMFACPECRVIYHEEDTPRGKGIQIEGADEEYLMQIEKENFSIQSMSSYFPPDPVAEQQLRRCLAPYREIKSNQRQRNEGAGGRAKYFEGNKGHYAHFEGYYGNSEDGAAEATSKLCYDLNFVKSLTDLAAPFTSPPGEGFLK